MTIPTSNRPRPEGAGQRQRRYPKRSQTERRVLDGSDLLDEGHGLRCVNARATHPKKVDPRGPKNPVGRPAVPGQAVSSGSELLIRGDPDPSTGNVQCFQSNLRRGRQAELDGYLMRKRIGPRLSGHRLPTLDWRHCNGVGEWAARGARLPCDERFWTAAQDRESGVSGRLIQLYGPELDTCRFVTARATNAGWGVAGRARATTALRVT